VSRADRVAARLPDRRLDLLLVTGLINVRYLTGFTGTNGLAIVGARTRRFLTDFRYVEQAKAQVTDGFDRETVPRELRLGLADGWPEGPVRLGFEDQHVSVRALAALRETLPDRIELVPAGGLVEEERARKEPAEIAAIRAAAALTDEVYEWVAERGVVGRTERELAIALEHEMRLRGAEPAFPSIVASGEHGARPHAVPRDAPVAAGVLITLDMGARVDGYCSDCTRTWATGPLPDELAAIHATVVAAEEAGVAAVRPGPTGRQVDAAARDLIAAAGHGEHFGHGLGHGVGLEIHEAPRLAQNDETPLAAGHVVTVEPGIYVPGLGGVRVEDLVLVTEDGHEVLSATTRAPRVVA
jgi:Xaa-Pro aminopeptidase